MTESKSGLIASKIQQKLSGIFDLLVLVLFGAIDLLTLIFGKYLNHRLDFEDFNPLYRGNLFTLIFSIVMMLLFIIFWLKDRNEFTRRRMLMLSCWFLGFGFTIGGIYLNQSNTGSGVNLLGTPFYKLYTGVFFNIGFAFKTLLLAYVFMKILAWKRFVVAGSAVIMLLLYVSLFVYTWVYVGEGVNTRVVYTSQNPADMGVILGAAVWKYNKPSSILKMRIEKGLQLYSKGIVKKLQLTGNNAPGELPEADVAFYYLLNKKIDPADIRLETESRSTLDQISYIKSTLIERNGYQKIIVISDAFHLPRIKEMAEFYNLKIDLVNSDLAMTSESLRYYVLREVVGLINFWMFGVK